MRKSNESRVTSNENIILRVTRYALLITILLVSVSYAATSSLDPMTIGVGARSLAMGRTNLAVAGDINALFVNPANAAYLPDWGATSMYTSLLEGDINYTLFGAAKKFAGIGTAGLSYLGGITSGISETTRDANSRITTSGNTFDYSNSTITAAFGTEMFDGFAAGASLKLFSKSFGAQGSGSGVSADLGMLLKMNPALNLGLVAQNILPLGINWSTNTKENLAMNVKGGAQYRPLSNLLINADIDSMPVAEHAGIEWRPVPLLALRGGVENLPTGNSTSVMNLMGGVGLSFSGLNFDYAYFNDGSLVANSTHFFTLSFAPEAQKTAVVEKPVEQAIAATPEAVAPPVIAPAAPKAVKKAPKKPIAKPKPPAKTKIKTKTKIKAKAKVKPKHKKK